MPRLERLNLFGCRHLQWPPLAQLLPRVPQLRHLDINGCNELVVVDIPTGGLGWLVRGGRGSVLGPKHVVATSWSWWTCQPVGSPKACVVLPVYSRDVQGPAAVYLWADRPAGVHVADGRCRGGGLTPSSGPIGTRHGGVMAERLTRRAWQL